jgi:hypothetical protein
MSLRWWPLLLLPLLASCKAKDGEPCKADTECGTSLVCFEAKCHDAARVCREEPAYAEACKRHGRCSVVAGRCAAANDADCSSTRRCTELGHCKLAEGCCSRDGTCAPAREAAIDLLLKLAVEGERDEAFEGLATLQEQAAAEDHGDRRGARSVALADELAAPLAKMAGDAAMPVGARAKALKLLAATPRPAAVGALEAAIAAYRPDAAPGPMDAAMAPALEAVAALRPAGTEAEVLRLVQTVRASTGRSQSLAYATQRAAVALAPPKWEAALREILAGAIEPDGPADKWRDEVWRQRTAALTLGRMRAAGAVDALIAVALLPSKADVADAAVEALVMIGKPAALAARELADGGKKELWAPAEAELVGAESERKAADVRAAAAAVLTATLGRRDAEAAVIDALGHTDELGKGKVALALPHLPPSAAVRGAFRKVYEASPLDLDVSAEFHGVEALLRAAPAFLDAELTPWLVDRAVAMQGTDTELAPFRDAALWAAMMLMTEEQLGKVGELAALVSPDKYEADMRAAKDLLGRCHREVSCFLGALPPLGAEEGKRFEHLKAATMAAMLAVDGDVPRLATAVLERRDATLRRAIAAGIERLRPDGDASLADELEKRLGEIGNLDDPVVRVTIGRLRARVP